MKNRSLKDAVVRAPFYTSAQAKDPVHKQLYSYGHWLGSSAIVDEATIHHLPSIHGHDHFSMSGCVRHGRQIKASRHSLYANLGFTSGVCGSFLQVWQLKDVGWWKVYGMKQ